MTSQAIFAKRALTPFEEIDDAVVVIDNGKITAIGCRHEIVIPPSALLRDANGLTIVPGFVDVHVHGAGGRDVMEATGEALDTVVRSLARYGTTSLVATTVTASEADTCRAVSGIASWIQSQHGQPLASAPRAEVLGIHFEGPFISPVRRGVHPLEHITAPSIALFQTFLDAARGTALMMTLAPELPGAMALIDAAREKGIVVSLGHSDANYAQASEAISHGARHAAHVFNAMRPFEHRETGIIGAVLTTDGITAELIADGVHVDSAAMRILVACKSVGGVILVSDSIAATGMPDGRYRLGAGVVNVQDGVPRSADGKLAGSTLTLDRALRNIIALGVPLQEALAMLTANPARLLCLEKKKGTLAPGADADLVLLNEHLEVAGVMTRGIGWPMLEPTRQKDLH